MFVFSDAVRRELVRVFNEVDYRFSSFGSEIKKRTNCTKNRNISAARLQYMYNAA